MPDLAMELRLLAQVERLICEGERRVLVVEAAGDRLSFGHQAAAPRAQAGLERDPLCKPTFGGVDHYIRKPDYLRELLKVLPPLNARPGTGEPTLL